MGERETEKSRERRAGWVVFKLGNEFASDMVGK